MRFSKIQTVLCQAPVPLIIWGILKILRDLTIDDLISYSLDLAAALIALLVFKFTNLHRNILGRLIAIKQHR